MLGLPDCDSLKKTPWVPAVVTLLNRFLCLIVLLLLIIRQEPILQSWMAETHYTDQAGLKLRHPSAVIKRLADLVTKSPLHSWCHQCILRMSSMTGLWQKAYHRDPLSCSKVHADQWQRPWQTQLQPKDRGIPLHTPVRPAGETLVYTCARKLS